MGDVLYPLLIICALFGVFMLVAVGSSYFLLRWYQAEMTRCPQCRRRGAGELMESEEVGSKAYIRPKNVRTLLDRLTRAPQRVRVTEKTYDDHYRCRRCGHEWTAQGKEREQELIK